MLQHCASGKFDEAYQVMSHLWSLGYAPEDIIGIVFRIAKNHNLPEYLKLEFIRVRKIPQDKVKNLNRGLILFSTSSKVSFLSVIRYLQQWVNELVIYWIKHWIVKCELICIVLYRRLASRIWESPMVLILSSRCRHFWLACAGSLWLLLLHRKWN